MRSFPVGWDYTLDVWYDREWRSWMARYADKSGNQLGDSWQGPTKEHCLIFRPSLEDTLRNTR